MANERGSNAAGGSAPTASAASVDADTALLHGRRYSSLITYYSSLAQRKFARDVAALQVSNTTQRVMSFAASVALARLLGRDGYGEYLLVVALFTSVNLLGNVGVGQFLVTRLAEAHAAADSAEVRRLAGYQLKVSLLVTGVLAALGLLAAPWLGAQLYGRPDLGSAARILFVGAPLTVLLGLASIGLQSVRRMKDVALLENVAMVVGTAGGVLAVLAGAGLTGLLVATVAGNALACGLGVRLYRRVLGPSYGFPSLSELLASARSVPLGAYFRFSAFAVVDKTIASLFAQTPVLFLGAWASLADVTAYGIAANMFALPGALHGAVARSLAVRLSHEKGRGNLPRLQAVLWQVSLAWGGISLLLSLVFAALMPVFALLYGADKMPSLALVLVYALYMGKLGFSVGFGSVFLVMDRMLTNVIVKLLLMAAAVPFGITLVQRFGSVGAIAYLLGSYLAGDAIYVALLCTRWFWGEEAGGKRQEVADGGERLTPTAALGPAVPRAGAPETSS